MLQKITTIAFTRIVSMQPLASERLVLFFFFCQKNKEFSLLHLRENKNIAIKFLLDNLRVQF